MQITVTDKAYGCLDHLTPIHTDKEAQMMNHVEQELVIEIDKMQKKPCMAKEYSFKQQVTKFWHSDNYHWHRIMQSGQSNWQYLWYLQTFFFNLYTSFGGGRISGTSCVNPPTIHEYLFSCNNNLLINPPHDLVEEVVAIKNGYYIDE